MNDAQSDGVRGFVEHWKMLGPKLADLERREMANFRPEEHRAELDALMEIGHEFAEPHTSTGLQEQQRLFMKRRGIIGT